MQQFLPILATSTLFGGLRQDDIAVMLPCLNATMRSYRKGDYVRRQGERSDTIAVVVRGQLHIQQDDFWGNCHIVSSVEAGDVFGEAYAVPDGEAMPHDVVAVADSTVIFFDIRRVITTCSSACRFHILVVQNTFEAIAAKNRELVRKLGHMSRRTTREKLLSYLSEEARRRQRRAFTIPFNRQQLADYLSVDRSAMSNELCKLRDDGILRFHKNHFELL